MILGNHLDFDSNEAQNVVIHNVATLPASPRNGMIVYLTQAGAQGLYLRREGNWVNLGEVQALENGAIQITPVSGVQFLSVRVDGQTLEINASGNIAVRQNGIGTREIDTANVRLNNFAAPNANVSMANFRITNLGAPINNTDAVNKEYVDLEIAQKIAAMGQFMGDWAGPGYPTTGSGSGGAIVRGDWWKITAAFNLGGEAVEVGDALFTRVDAPGQTSTNWFVLQSNVGEATSTALGLVRVSTSGDLTAVNGANTTRVVRIADLLARTATETRTGLIRLATQAEVLAGTVADRAVTPSTLSVFVNTALNSRGFVAQVGNGTATSVAITHNLNTRNIIAQVVENSGDERQVLVPVRKNTANQVTIDFRVAPTNNQFKILIYRVD